MGNATSVTPGLPTILQHAERGSVTLITMIGHIGADNSGTAAFRQRMRDLINNRDRRFVINLKEATVDESGVEALANLEQELVELGFPFVLLDVPAAMEQQFEQSKHRNKLSRRFTDLTEALDVAGGR